jgi:hypothetical protein
MSITPLGTVPQTDLSIERLNGYRGYFTHFTPKGWSLQLSALPLFLGDSIGVIHWSAFESGVSWYKTSHERRTKKSLNKLRRLTNAWSGREV